MLGTTEVPAGMWYFPKLTCSTVQRAGRREIGEFILSASLMHALRKGSFERSLKVGSGLPARTARTSSRAFDWRSRSLARWYTADDSAPEVVSWRR